MGNLDGREVVPAKSQHTYYQQKKEDDSEYVITETKSTHHYLPSNIDADSLPKPKSRFSTHLAEDEPDPEEEEHVIELPSVSEWDVSRSVTMNKDRRDLKDHMDQIQSDIAVVFNQGVEAVSKWDYGKSYTEMKDTVEKIGANTVEEVKKVKDPTGGLWGDFTTILSDVATATIEELVGDNRRVINKNVGFFRVEGDSSSEEDNLAQSRFEKNPQNNQKNPQSYNRKNPPQNSSKRNTEQFDNRRRSPSSTTSSSSASEEPVAIVRSSRHYESKPLPKSSSSSGEDMPFERQESISCDDDNNSSEAVLANDKETGLQLDTLGKEENSQ